MSKRHFFAVVLGVVSALLVSASPTVAAPKDAADVVPSSTPTTRPLNSY